MQAFTIKDLENLSGIKAHTIRIWEQRYHFLKPLRTDTNIRQYSSEELKAVLNIALLNKYGYKISHIDRMNEGEIRERILSLTANQAQQDRLVNELIQHLMDLDLEAFESLINEQILVRGIDKTITQLLFPFMEKIGLLWMTNRINPAQEHLVTNIIRQKLIVGIESAFSQVDTGQTALLFLPEGEFHETGLLYMHYLLKGRGIHVLYLGANVPVKDIEFVANLKRPKFLYTHLTSLANNFHFEKFLNNFHIRCPSHLLVVSGMQTQFYKKKIPPNVTLIKSLPEVMEYLATID